MRGRGDLGSGAIVDPRVTEEVTPPTGSVGEADSPHSGVRAPQANSLPPCSERKEGYPNNRTDHLL
jgi:hypothetical protein